MIFEKSKEFRFLRSKALFQIYVFLIYFIVSAASIQGVEAAEEVCCEESNGGEFCVYIDEEDCKPGAMRAAVSCEQTNFCGVGCCGDIETGDCSNAVPKATCESKENSIFYGSFDCDKVGFCDKGCCEIGSNFRFITKKACEILIEENFPFLDVEDVWNGGIGSEEECIYQSVEEDEGCCVKEGEYGFEGDCDWTTRGSCSTLGLEDENGGPGFYKGVYCSNEGLQCDCVSNDHKGCAGEDVYWFDSCGNKENLVEDCDYFGETICKEKDGSASCRSINCEDTNDYPKNNHDPAMGGFRHNGESWCVYEGRVGPAMDLVGSRHYRVMCVDGEELIEPCRDFREEYCVQFSENESEFNFAKCIESDGFECVSECNQKPFDSNKQKNKQCCDEYASCLWNDGICMPLIPPGNLDAEYETSSPNFNTKQMCDVGDTTCTSIWVKKLGGNWECKANCHCRNYQWVSDANLFCQSLGDCGAHYNVAGKWTKKGQGTSGKTRILNKNSEKPFSFYAESGDILHVSFEELSKFSNDFRGDYWDYDSGKLSIGKHANRVGEFWEWIAKTVKNWFGDNWIGSVVSVIAMVIVVIYYTVFIAVYVIIEVLKWVFGWGKTKKRYHNFDCRPWVPPNGGDDCEKCDSLSVDGLCTEYKCKSLGKQCELINWDDPVKAECIKGDVDDVIPPVLSPWREVIQEQGHDIDVLGSNCGGYEVIPDVEPLERFTMGIKTNEYAECRYDFNHTFNYYDMLYSFDQGYLSLEHNFTKIYPGGQDYNVFVRCLDKYGNGEDSCEYIIKFGTKEEPDFTAPIVLDTSIPHGGAVTYGLNETPLILFLNEPVEVCRWDRSNVPFEQMAVNNSFLCACYDGETSACTGIKPPEPGEELCDYLDGYGLFVEESFECIGLLQDIQEEQMNEYYISCVDIQKEDGTGCNFNENYKFDLYGSSPLNIISVEPENGTYYYPNFVLRVATSGGSNDGNSICYYDSGFGMIEFFDTGGTTHVQEQTRAKGEYEYLIKCVDAVGNEANETRSIKIDVDTNPPEVENLYLQGGVLYLITDEPSTCEYSVESENFNIGEGLEMVGVMVDSHSLVMVEDTYYIKCYDEFDNVGDAVVVHNV